MSLYQLLENLNKQRMNKLLKEYALKMDTSAEHEITVGRLTFSEHFGVDMYKSRAKI